MTNFSLIYIISVIFSVLPLMHCVKSKYVNDCISEEKRE